MRQININGFNRVTRTTAQKLFNEGKNVYGVPCNLRPSNQYCILFNNTKGSFSHIENEAMYYNCNNETGKTLWFYTYDKE